jgi:hypothetical protein
MWCDGMMKQLGREEEEKESCSADREPWKTMMSPAGWHGT